MQPMELEMGRVEIWWQQTWIYQFPSGSEHETYEVQNPEWYGPTEVCVMRSFRTQSLDCLASNCLIIPVGGYAAI